MFPVQYIPGYIPALSGIPRLILAQGVNLTDMLRGAGKVLSIQVAPESATFHVMVKFSSSQFLYLVPLVALLQTVLEAEYCNRGFFLSQGRTAI